MSQTGKLMPNLDRNSTKILNLTVLQRMVPYIVEILITAVTSPSTSSTSTSINGVFSVVDVIICCFVLVMVDISVLKLDF
ncbi:putative mRNA-decapping enzyme subunit 1 [Helianthus anomalus]